jgi:hypothetical protein
MRATHFGPGAIALVLGAAVSVCPHTTRAEVKTSKERLSDKAADEQRVDNCRVPVERRGAVMRPTCPGEDRPPTAGSGQDTTATPQPR